MLPLLPCYGVKGVMLAVLRASPRGSKKKTVSKWSSGEKNHSGQDQPARFSQRYSSASAPPVCCSARIIRPMMAPRQ